MPKRNQSRVGRVMEGARDMYDTSKERVMDAKESTEEMISKHPITWVAAAAAVGALVALGVNALVQSREKPSFMRRVKDYF